MAKSPKHHLADPGLAAYLMGVDEGHLLGGTPGSSKIFGQLFESLMLMTLRGAASAAEASVYHVRTSNGDHEVDAIIERYDGKVIAVESKASASISTDDVAHLHWLHRQLGDRLVDKVIVYTGEHAYRRPDGVAVVPLALLA